MHVLVPQRHKKDAKLKQRKNATKPVPGLHSAPYPERLTS